MIASVDPVNRTGELPGGLAPTCGEIGTGLGWDIEEIRSDFPTMAWDLRPGVPLVYLDSAATCLKPWPVIQAMQKYYTEYPAGVHRGPHTLGERATEVYEAARRKVAEFLGTDDAAEVIFTGGTTESINLVAQSWGRAFLKPGDEILASALEHHANLVPWQMLAQERGLVLKLVEPTVSGRLDFGSFLRQFSNRVRLVAITGMSNALGTVPPLREIVDLAHLGGARVLVDAAQSALHTGVDVKSLDADFVALSAHKMCGPSGVGVLYAKRELLEAMPPVYGGAGMVSRFDIAGSEWNEVPWKFEPGTPPIAEAIGLGAAVIYLRSFDHADLLAYERALTLHAHRRLSEIRGLRRFGPEPEDKGPIVAFTVEDVPPHELAQILDRAGVAIRAGNHCAMPLHERLGVPATARASFAFYNTIGEIDVLGEAIERAQGTLLRRRSSRN